jgi:hypothetical protein
VRVCDCCVTILPEGRDWAYLLSLLIPLVVYELALKVISLVSEYPAEDQRRLQA